MAVAKGVSVAGGAVGDGSVTLPASAVPLATAGCAVVAAGVAVNKGAVSGAAVAEGAADARIAVVARRVAYVAKSGSFNPGGISQ